MFNNFIIIIKLYFIKYISSNTSNVLLYGVGHLSFYFEHTCRMVENRNTAGNKEIVQPGSKLMSKLRAKERVKEMKAKKKEVTTKSDSEVVENPKLPDELKFELDSEPHDEVTRKRYKRYKQFRKIIAKGAGLSDAAMKNYSRLAKILGLTDDTRSPSELPERKKNNQVVDNLDFTMEYLSKGVEAFFKLIKSSENSKQSDLFEGRTDYILLHVFLHKIPYLQQEEFKRHLSIPHCLIGDDQVGLFVLNKKMEDADTRTLEEKIDHTVNFYQDWFQRLGITRIGAVIPKLQLDNDYKTYEMKRQLASHFEIFLCDRRMRSTQMNKVLTKVFMNRDKAPISIALAPTRIGTKNIEEERKNHENALKESIEKKVLTTSLTIHKSTANLFIKVGNMSMNVQQITENIYEVIRLLNDKQIFPGGHNNIAKILLESNSGAKLPFYFDLRNPNWIQVPFVRAHTQGTQESVEGELSTRPGQIFTVLPNGQVFVRRKGGEELSDDESDIDDSDIDDKDRIDVKNKKQIKKEVNKDTANSSGSEDEDFVKNAEERYMADWSKEWLLKVEKDDEEDVTVTESETKPNQKRKKTLKFEKKDLVKKMKKIKKK